MNHIPGINKKVEPMTTEPGYEIPPGYEIVTGPPEFIAFLEQGVKR